MIPSKLFLVFAVGVQVQVYSEKIDFDRIFHSPKPNYDDMEILERSNFEPDDPKVDSKISTYNKDEPKAVANAQVLLNFPNRADVPNSHKGRQNLPVIESRSFEEPRMVNQQHSKCYYPFPMFYPGPVPQNTPCVYPKELYHHYPYFYGGFYPPMIRPTTILSEQLLTTPMVTCPKQTDYPTTYPIQFPTSTPMEILTTITPQIPCKIYEDLLEIIERMSLHLLQEPTNPGIHFDNDEKTNIAEALSIIVRYLNAKCKKCTTCLQDPNYENPKELSIEVSLILEDILSMLPITLLQIRNGKLILLNQLNCLLDMVKYVREAFGHHRGLCEFYKDIKDMFRPCIFLKDPSTAYQSKANIRGYLLMDSLNLALYLAGRNKIGGDYFNSKEDIIDLWVDYLYKTQFLDCHEVYGDRVYPNIRKIEQLLVKLRKLFLYEYAIGLRAKNPLINGLDNLLEFFNTKPVTFPPIGNEIDFPCSKEKKHRDVLDELEKHKKLNLEEILSLVESYLKRKYNLGIHKGDNFATTTLEPNYWSNNIPIYQEQDDEQETNLTPSEPINFGQVEPICQHPDRKEAKDKGKTNRPINFGPITPLRPCTDKNPPTIIPVSPVKPTDTPIPEEDHTEGFESINFGPTAPIKPCARKDLPIVVPINPIKPTDPPEPDEDYTEEFEPINFGPIATIKPCVHKDLPIVVPINPIKPTDPPEPDEDYTEPFEPINFGPIATIKPCVHKDLPIIVPINPIKPTDPPKPDEDYTEPFEPINFGPIATIKPCVHKDLPIIVPIDPIKPTDPPKPDEDYTEEFEPINFGPIAPIKPCVHEDLPIIVPIDPIKPTDPPKPDEDYTEEFEPINFGPIAPIKPCVHKDLPIIVPIDPIKPTDPPEPDEDYTEPFEPINFGPIAPIKPCVHKDLPIIVPIDPIKPTDPPEPDEDYTEPFEPINFGPIATIKPCVHKDLPIIVPINPIKSTDPPQPDEDYTDPFEPINFGPVTPIKPCIHKNPPNTDPISPIKPTDPPNPEDDDTEPFEPINFGPVTPIKPCIHKNPPNEDPISPIKPTDPPKPVEDHTEPFEPIDFGPIGTLKPCIDDVNPISPVKPTEPPKPKEDHTEPTEPTDKNPPKIDPISPVEPTHLTIPGKGHTDPINFEPTEPTNSGQDNSVTVGLPDYLPGGSGQKRMLTIRPATIDEQVVDVSPCDMDFWPDHCNLTPIVKKPALVDDQVVNVSPCDMDFWPDHCNLTPIVKKPALVDDQVVNVSPCDMDFWPDHCNLTPVVKEPAPIDDQVVNVSPCDMDFWPDHCNLTPVVKEPALIDDQVVNVSPCDMDFWPDRCNSTPAVKEPAPIDDQVVNISPCDMDFWPDHCNLSSSVKKSAPIDDRKIVDVKPCKDKSFSIGGCTEANDDKEIDKDSTKGGHVNPKPGPKENHQPKPIEVIPIKLPSNQPIQLLCPDYLKHILNGNHQFILVPKIPPECEESEPIHQIPSNFIYGGLPGSKYNILKSQEPLPCLSCSASGCGKIKTDLDGLNPKTPSSRSDCHACGNCKICPNGRRCPYCAPYTGELTF